MPLVGHQRDSDQEILKGKLYGIVQQDSYKYLGITITNSGKIDGHIEFIVKKISKTNNRIKGVMNCTQLSVRHKINLL
jgi:hypothetical protein